MSGVSTALCGDREVTEIACIGAGYVGGPTMAVLAKSCPNIRCTVIDINKRRIDAWNSGKYAVQEIKRLPIYEPGLQELVESRRNVNLFFTTDASSAIKRAQIIFIAVNTPNKEHGHDRGFDMAAYESAALSIAQHADTDVIVVEKSTVPVRTAERLQTILLANRRHSGISFEILSNPEFLAEGSAVKDSLEPDRILIGGQKTPTGLAAVQQLSRVYQHWVPKEKIIATGLWSAELAKLTCNAFLAQRVSSINAISAVCESVGADVDEVAQVVGSDHRIGAGFLKASIGFGGSCFNKDILGLIYLAESFHLPEVAEYFRQVLKMNAYQKDRFCRLVLDRMFGNLAHKNICILGFSFKKDTGDTRESAAIDVAKFMLQEAANVFVYDPKVAAMDVAKVATEICFEQDPYTACMQAHAVLVLTEWEEFNALDWKRIYANMQKPAYVFDGRNILDVALLKETGFQVFCLGK